MLAVQVVQVEVELPLAWRRPVCVLEKPLQQLPLRKGRSWYHDEYASFVGGPVHGAG